jgi:ankyrin repeat protein
MIPMASTTNRTTASNHPPPEWDRILIATQKNDSETVRHLIDVEGVSPSHGNAIGQTALHVAALWGNTDVLSVLLEKGGNPNLVNTITGASPLHMCVQSSKGNTLATARLLLDGGANPSLQDFYGSIPLHYCTDDPNPNVDKELAKQLRRLLKPTVPEIFQALERKEFESLLHNPTNLQLHIHTRHLGQTLLMTLVDDLCLEPAEEEKDASTSMLDLLQQLVEAGADPNALPFVERNRDIDILQQLQQVGADPDALPSVDSMEDSSGKVVIGSMEELEEQTPDASLHKLALALQQTYRTTSSSTTGRIQLFQKAILVLKDHGATITDATRQLVHDAARRDQVELVQFWINDLGIDCNSRGRQGMTPLQFAARSGKIHMVVFLLSLQDIDISLADSRGQTSLLAAQANGHEEIGQLIQQHPTNHSSHK